MFDDRRIMGHRIIITNATILTLDAQDTFLYPGILEIRDDRIYSIHSGSVASGADYDGETEVIDGTDKLVMPGLVDLHFHTAIAKVRHPQTQSQGPHSLSDRAMAMMHHSGNTSTKYGIPPFVPSHLLLRN